MVSIKALSASISSGFVSRHHVFTLGEYDLNSGWLKLPLRKLCDHGIHEDLYSVKLKKLNESYTDLVGCAAQGVEGAS